jgi:hypothetical protein
MTADTLAQAPEQPAAWNKRDRTLQDTYFPVVVTGCHGVALMCGKDVHGFSIDDPLGMPTWSTITLGS